MWNLLQTFAPSKSTCTLPCNFGLSQRGSARATAQNGVRLRRQPCSTKDMPLPPGDTEGSFKHSKKEYAIKFSYWQVLTEQRLPPCTDYSRGWISDKFELLRSFILYSCLFSLSNCKLRPDDSLSVNAFKRELFFEQCTNIIRWDFFAIKMLFTSIRT